MVMVWYSFKFCIGWYQFDSNLALESRLSICYSLAISYWRTLSLFGGPIFSKVSARNPFLFLFVATAFSKTRSWFLSFQEMSPSFLFLATAFSRTTSCFYMTCKKWYHPGLSVHSKPKNRKIFKFILVLC